MMRKDLLRGPGVGIYIIDSEDSSEKNEIHTHRGNPYWWFYRISRTVMVSPGYGDSSDASHIVCRELRGNCRHIPVLGSCRSGCICSWVRHRGRECEALWDTPRQDRGNRKNPAIKPKQTLQTSRWNTRVSFQLYGKGEGVSLTPQISFPEVPVGGNQFVFQFRKGSRHPDGLLPRLEDLATGQVHRWVLLVGAGQVF